MDSEAGRLLKHGIAVQLRDQPLQVLAALVERAGDIVTRQELRERLWRDQAFGDFEAGLNTSMSRLRQVLNDSVESPSYIETVPKRGYRFIALVLKQAAAVPSNQNRNSEACIAYLKGHYLTKRHTPANSARALEYYEEAIRLDPDYSLPYHGASLVR